MIISGPEAALFASEMDWTILRNAVYSDVMLMFAGKAVASGQLLSATAEGRRGYATRADCARVAAAALLSQTGKHVYDVTGPEAISHHEIAACLSELSGKTIFHSSKTPAEMEQVYSGGGMPSFLAKALAGSDDDASQGLHGMVTSTVERMTGRKATKFSDFLREQMETSAHSVPD